jgi:hypothetical protein
VLHDQEIDAVLAADIVEGVDMRMVQARDRSRLALEAHLSEFDVAYEEGSMFLPTMNPQIIGYRSRMAVPEKLVQYIRSRPDVWFATHEQVLRHVKESGASKR